MKRLFYFIAVMALFPLIGKAQTKANLAEGYYRVQNKTNNRYMALLDNKGHAKRNGSTIDADLYAIRSLNDTNNIYSNPATIVHIKKGSSGYVCSAQGTSTKDITNYEFDIYNRTSGSTIQVSVTGATAILTEFDYKTKTTIVNGYSVPGKTLPDSGLVNQSGTGTSNRIYWTIKKVDNSTNYVGFTPTLSVGGKYYDTFYAEFPFTVTSSGVKVYSVYTIYNGKAVLKPFETGETVPGGTPVLVECSAKDAKSNMITPVLGTYSALSQNQLKGVYFNYYCDKESNKIHNNRTAYDGNTMRVLSVVNGKLAFVKSSTLKYLPANKAYLSVSSGTADQVETMTYEEYQKVGKCDINGDGVISAADYQLVLNNLDTSVTKYDVNGDGVVTAADLQILLNNM